MKQRISQQMRRLASYFAGGTVIALCVVGLTATHDPQEADRAEAHKQEAVEKARRQYLMRQKMARIASETRLQLAEVQQ